MVQYFKQHISAKVFVFFAFYGEGKLSSTGKAMYSIRESAFFCKEHPNISQYSAECQRMVGDDYTPCSKEEFEAAKTAALTAIASLMGEPQLQAA